MSDNERSMPGISGLTATIGQPFSPRELHAMRRANQALRLAHHDEYEELLETYRNEYDERQAAEAAAPEPVDADRWNRGDA
jgi:hypothetical protein